MSHPIPRDVHIRSHYLEKVRPFMDQKMIKVITGQRRVGKSYLLFQLINFIRDKKGGLHFLYINKEDLAFSFIKNAADLNEYVLANKAKHATTYVFIDEIQDIADFGTALRSLLLHDDIDPSLQVASAKIGYLIPIFCYAKIHPLNTTRERPYFHDVGCQSHLLYNR